MSDIVLKDKSGVKNTYSDINAINIPDGNGGFVKYSLGGTHLPEYDGTVIIEKAESVLGLRRFKESVTPYLTITSEDELPSFYTEHYFDIPTLGDINRMTPCVVGDGEICVVVGNETEPLNVMTLFDVNLYFPDGFEILSTSNSTVDEWLLANTEGVSV